jgi:hypothetical protein
VLFLVHRFLSPWWRRRQVPPKRRFLQEPHGVTTQKTPFFKCWFISSQLCATYPRRGTTLSLSLILHSNWLCTILLTLSANWYLSTRPNSKCQSVTVSCPSTNINLHLPRRMPSYGILRRVALVRTTVSEERSASVITVTKIGEIGRMLAVDSYKSQRPRSRHSS